MDAALNAPVAPRSWYIQPWVVWLARIASAALMALAFSGLAILARRASGSLVRPLDPAALTLVALALAGSAWMFRRVWQPIAAPRATPDVSPAAGRLMLVYQLAPSLVLVFWGLGVLLPGTRAAGLLAFLAVTLGAEAASWLPWLAIKAPPLPVPELRIAQEYADEPAPLDAAEFADEFAEQETADEEDDNDSVWQQLTRRVDGESDVLEGWVRASLAAGERHALVHVAICPPMSGVPECEAEPADGPAFAVKLGQVLPFGVRFEIKLDEPAEEPTSVVVAFTLSAAV